MSGLEALGAVVGVVAVVAQIVSAYRDGGSIIDNIKEKRARKRGRPLPRQLEESVKDTPGDIERETNRGVSKFGSAFEQGDYIAIITIQNIAIQVHSKFFEKLRNAYEEDTDFTSLINDADMGRNNTITALIELQQRLLLAAPIPNAPLLAQAPSQRGQSRDPRMEFSWETPFLHSQPSDRTMSQTQLRSTGEASSRDQRRPRFGLFHRSRVSNDSRKSSQDSLADGSSAASMQRVWTMPPDESVTSSRFSASPPTTSSPAVHLSRRRTPSGPSTQVSLPSSFPINDPWDNPWGEDVAPASRPVPTPMSSSMPSSHPMRVSTSQSSSSTYSVPHPNPSNNYLGFCKGAWKLQDGDRKAMVVSRDYTQSAQSTMKILRCSECKFEGLFSPDTIWDRVFKFDTLGMKIRWSFLAKSHVHQRYPQKRDLARVCDFTYQCIFCAFLGQPEPAIHGAQAYRDHISKQHHGTSLSDVVLYKAGAVDDRVCDDSEDFDINLYPRRSSQISARSSQVSELSGHPVFP